MAGPTTVYFNGGGRLEVEEDFDTVRGRLCETEALTAEFNRVDARRLMVRVSSVAYIEESADVRPREAHTGV